MKFTGKLESLPPKELFRRLKLGVTQMCGCCLMAILVPGLFGDRFWFLVTGLACVLILLGIAALSTYRGIVFLEKKLADQEKKVSN